MKSFVEPMLARFERPSGGDAAQFFSGLGESLSEFSDATLMAAVGHFRLTRKYRTFPLESECLEACRKVVVEPSRASRPKFLWEREEPRVSQERWIAARQMARCDLGREADAGGWLVALLEFCEREGRLPGRHEADNCQRIAGRSEAGLRRNFGTQLYQSLTRLRQIMLDKAHREVFGEGASPAVAGACHADFDVDQAAE